MQDWELTIIRILLYVLGGKLGRKVIGQIFRKPGDLEKYFGHYYSYHYTSKDKPLIERGKFEVVGVRSQITGVEATFSSDFDKYNGYLQKDAQGVLFLTLRHGTEVVQVVLSKVVPDNVTSLTGVWSGLTRENEPAAGKIYLKKIDQPNEISNMELATLTEDRIDDSDILTFLKLRHDSGEDSDSGHVVIAQHS